MFNKLLPFTLIASFALPFLTKADELQSPVNNWLQKNCQSRKQIL